MLLQSDCTRGACRVQRSDWIQCDGCDGWFHPTCQGMPMTAYYRTMLNAESAKPPFVCAKCNEQAQPSRGLGKVRFACMHIGHRTHQSSSAVSFCVAQHRAAGRWPVKCVVLAPFQEPCGPPAFLPQVAPEFRAFASLRRGCGGGGVGEQGRALRERWRLVHIGMGHNQRPRYLAGGAQVAKRG
jgi:hypothetical protein